MILFKNKKNDSPLRGAPVIRNYNSQKRGFTLPELLVVIAIIAILVASASTYLGQAKKKARDSKRLQDMQEIIKALHLYWSDNSYYPASNCDPHCAQNEWEISADNPSQWLTGLIPYFGRNVSVDPFNTRADFSSFGSRGNNYYYVYRRYDMPYGPCPEIAKPFIIIGIKHFEDLIPAADYPTADNLPLPAYITLPRAKCGDLGPDGNALCTVEDTNNNKCKDWSQELDYSIMLNE